MDSTEKPKRIYELINAHFEINGQRLEIPKEARLASFMVKEMKQWEQAFFSWSALPPIRLTFRRRFRKWWENSLLFKKLWPKRKPARRPVRYRWGGCARRDYSMKVEAERAYFEQFIGLDAEDDCRESMPFTCPKCGKFTTIRQRRGEWIVEGHLDWSTPGRALRQCAASGRAVDLARWSKP